MLYRPFWMGDLAVMPMDCCRWARTRLPGHLSYSGLGKFAGRAHELAEAFACPGIQILPGVDREFAGLPERGASADASVLGQCRGDTRDPIAFAEIARSVGTSKELRKFGLG